MKKNFKNSEKTLEEFYNKVENIASTTQDKFINEIEDLTYEGMKKFRNLLARELDSIFKNINSRSANLLNHSLHEYAANSHFITKKEELELFQSILHMIKHTIKNL
ncbi:hypothetical protein [Wolbachia endosymbiont of Chironomus riparius]|uniref:hypothetical protein n=1 Tax=Wolbachia endosymbiont of Chironomus riparius TaxID=2883238 RepID=UPI0020A0D5B5|nr:hypothetical protein [Wolbachia endosymbiont of Chironomus riparius]